MINCVLFGYGRAGKIHYKNLINSHYFKLKYLVDVRDLSGEINNSDIISVNINNHKEVESMKNDASLEAVFITTPTSTHFTLVSEYLTLGKHVFVEKPISNNYEEIINCFQLAESRDLTLLVGYNRRFDPKLLEIKKRLDAKEIGDLKYAITISRDYPYPSQEYLKISSGLYHDCATHDIDYLNWMIGDKPVSVSVVSDNNLEEFNHDYVNINLKYMNGIIASLNLSRIASSYDQRCEFYGTNGEILNNEFAEKQKLSFPERYQEAYQAEINYFAKCIREHIIPDITQEDCLANYSIAQACEEACLKNKKITVKYNQEYRNYKIVSQAVKENYQLARRHQTYSFVKDTQLKYATLDAQKPIWEILTQLNNFIDVSDPDCSHPNLYHAIQTAEMIRRDGHPDWFQLIGLIHDIGKIMYLKGDDASGTGKNKQWAIVGDTFVVGCKLPENIVFPEFNRLNPDMSNPEMNTTMGIYQEGCGLDNLVCSWGHDEYLYRLLTSDKNPNSLPEEALYIVRFHSLYSYHLHGEYRQFQSEKDKRLFHWLKTFNKYDLYSKTDELVDIDAIRTYYQTLIKKYFTNDVFYY